MPILKYLMREFVRNIYDRFYCFYRAMHFSSKRGLAIACRPSVRLSVSVTLVDWIVIT